MSPGEVCEDQIKIIVKREQERKKEKKKLMKKREKHEMRGKKEKGLRDRGSLVVEDS